MARFCKYCGAMASTVRMHSRDVCWPCYRDRSARFPVESPKRIFGANSIWDADEHFRAKFRILQRNAAREAKKRDPQNVSPCWLWTMKIGHKGYGEWKWYDRATKKMYGSGVHRISLELFLGRPLAEGMVAGHVCPMENRVNGFPDRRCFREDHLTELTLSENMSQWGEEERARRDQEQIKEIIRLRDLGQSFTTVGATVGLSAETTRNLYEATKIQLADDERVNSPGKTVQSTKIDELVPVIRGMRYQGISWVQIEQDFGIRLSMWRRKEIEDESGN